MEKFDIYDKINTTAAVWLKTYKKRIGLPLGIRQFKINDARYKWLLQIINIVSIADGYTDFYIECNWFIWFYLRFIKKLKHVKRVKNNYDDITFIDTIIFIKEVCNVCESDTSIIESIYNSYWR